MIHCPSLRPDAADRTRGAAALRAARVMLPLERWAARAPATRWPLLLALLIVLVGLAGGATDCAGAACR